MLAAARPSGVASERVLRTRGRFFGQEELAWPSLSQEMARQACGKRLLGVLTSHYDSKNLMSVKFGEQ